MDDFDDVLNDLLAEGPAPTTKKKQPPAAARGAARRGKTPTVHDDDFYKSLAADVDSVSDVSDADPNEILAGMDDMDDMDAALFGSKKPEASPAGTDKSARKSPTPSSPSKSKGAGSPDSKPSANKHDFDYDDPLADLLSDDAPRKPKSAEVKAKSQTPPSTPADKPAAKIAGSSHIPKLSPVKKKGGDFDFDYDDPLADLLSDSPRRSTKPKPQEAKRDAAKLTTTPPSEDSSSESRRLEIKRPPTSSGSGTQKKTQSKQDTMFDDDDDVLDMFDSPRDKPASQVTSPDKGLSIMEDLLGVGAVTKHLETPGSAGSGGAAKREFVLDKKYTKQEAKPKELTEDDFNFGGYMPSAVTTPGSRPSSKRSVRFDDDEPPKSRGGSGGGGRRRGVEAEGRSGGGGGAKSVLEDMLNKDDRDWRDIASSDQTPPTKSRPHSEGSMRGQQEQARPVTGQTSTSEPVDWLGLSRIGSPKHADVDNERDMNLTSPSRPHSDGSRAVIPKELPDEPADWLGTSSPSRKRTNQKQEASAKKAEDWLGMSSGKDSDWLGGKDDAMDLTDPDDWLGLSKQKEKDSGKTDDWLGGPNKPVSPAKKTNVSVDNTLHLADPFAKTSLSKPPADERALDLFSPPPAKDISTSFPWDSDAQGTRRTKGRPRNQQGKKSEGPTNESTPKSPSSPLGRSPADSPQDQASAADVLRRPEAQPQKRAVPGPSASTAASSSPPGTSWGGGGGEMGLPGTPPSAGAGAGHRTASSQSVTDLGAATTSALFSSPILASSQMDSFRQQQEMFQKQQRMILEQHQQQQIEQHRLLAEEEERRRQQRMQIAEAQARMMHEQLSVMSKSSSQVTMMPGMGFGSPGMTDEMLGLVKRLEMEKGHLEVLLETTKNQHKEEIKLLIETHKKRTELIEESWSRREERLKEENEFLMAQSHTKMQQVEAEKTEMIESHMRKTEALERENRIEIERLREQHRLDVDSIRKEHEESLVRLRRAKDLELEAVSNHHATTQNLKGVLDSVAENTRGLNELQHQVHLKHTLNMDEREESARSRDEQLKSLQDRLERQHHDNEIERSRLQGLLSTMEKQLNEYVRSNEEDKWRIRQEDTRLQAAQDSVEKEKMMAMEQNRRDRADIQKAKDQLLEEQKTTLSQLYDERRQLAQERAAFEMETKLSTEKSQRENIKNVKTGAELEGSVRVISSEKARLVQQLEDLRAQQDRVSKERAELEQQQQSLAAEKEKLEVIALQVRQRSKDIEDMCLMAAQAREAGEASLAEAQRLAAEQDQRLQAIQVQLQTLRTKERQIAQERLSLAKERQTLEASANSLMCVSCRTPVRDVPAVEAMSQGQCQFVQNTLLGVGKMSPAASTLLTSLDPDLKAKVFALDSVSAEIEMDRSIRLWRIAAKKDEDFLLEESLFLKAVRHTPYSNALP